MRPAESTTRFDPKRSQCRFDRDGDAAVYVISVAADLAGVHPQTLRMYERKGLLEPSRTLGGSRRYSDRDLDRLRRIGELTAEGVNLEGVRRILDLEAEAERLRGELDQTRAQASEAVRAVHRQYRRDLVPYRAMPVPLWQARQPVVRTVEADGAGWSRRRIS